MMPESYFILPRNREIVKHRVSAPSRRIVAEVPEVRVLRAGVDRGLAGPDIVAGAAAGAGRGAGARARKIVASSSTSGKPRGGMARRPQAAALARLADPGRGWGAIVIGEYERAFYGAWYALMAPLFEHYGVHLWLPEVGGGSTSHPSTTSGRRRCLDCRPSGKSSGPASGCEPRWPPRRGTRAVTWAVGRSGQFLYGSLGRVLLLVTDR
jgi:hypothetical protein